MSAASLPAIAITPELVDAAHASKAWPFEEARRVLKRYAKGNFPDVVIFETGYGPSGLPHIGTFGSAITLASTSWLSPSTVITIL